MPTDVRDLLEQGAPAPVREVDVDAVSARGRQWRRRRTATTVATVAVVLGLAVLPLPRLLSSSPRVMLEGTADPREPALAYGIDGDIYVADADGANPVQIADGVRFDGAEECRQGEQRNEYVAFGSAWSPDGQYLAYWDWRPCPVPPHGNTWGTVIIADPAGNTVATFPGQGWLISWHPDSTRIAVFDSLGPFEAWRSGGKTSEDSKIGVYGLDGVRQATLTVPASLMPSGDVSPVWSQDGSSLLLSGVQVPLDGGSPRELPGGSKADRRQFGVYSPDGSRVAYLDRREPYGRGPLVVAEADGPDDQQAGNAGEFADAAWSPNGDRVAYIHESSVGTVDSDGLLVSPSELRVRDVATGAETSLVHVSASEGLAVIEFSSDGERIFFSRAEDSDNGVSSLWSINADGSEPRRLIPRIEWADWRPPAPTR